MTLHFVPLPVTELVTIPVEITPIEVMPPQSRPGASFTEKLYDARTDETLTIAAKLWRDSFIREYIIDMNGRNALVRLGVNYKTAGVRAAQMMREPYVRVKLREKLSELRPEDVVSRGQIMARMWQEANDFSSEPAVRVAALAHLAKMVGLIEHETKSVNINVGVMMVPVMTMDQWRSEALITQTKLKQLAAA